MVNDLNTNCYMLFVAGNMPGGEDKKAFAQAVKKHIGESFRKSKAKTKLEPFLS